MYRMERSKGIINNPLNRSKGRKIGFGIDGFYNVEAVESQKGVNRRIGSQKSLHPMV